MELTSPTTHEKIIEVLRPFVTVAEELDPELGDLTISIGAAITGEWRAARDLYQRLQAEKEGGWQPIETAPRDELTVVLVPGGIAHWSVSDQAWMSLTAQTWPGLPIQWEVRHWMPMPPIPPEYRPAPPLNQEGGDAAGTAGRDSSSEVGKHVAPPASANAGTGRAVVERWLAKNVPLPRITFLESESLQSLIDEALTSEHQRGLAEGERIGIEKAAKWHDDQIAIIEKQVAANNEYLTRHSGAMRAVIAANDSCSRHQTEHRLSATAIRSLTGDPQT